MSPRPPEATTPAPDGRVQAEGIIRSRTEALQRTVEQLVPDNQHRLVASEALAVFLEHITAALDR